MKKNAIEVFEEWADLDKDFGMEKNHRDSVNNMINDKQFFLFKNKIKKINKKIKINSILSDRIGVTKWKK